MQKLLVFGDIRKLYLFLMLGGMALGFCKWIVFSWVLPPIEFGVYSLTITSVTFLAYFGLFGLNEYIIKVGANLAGRDEQIGAQSIRDDVLLIGLLNSIMLIAFMLLFLYLTDYTEYGYFQYFMISGILMTTVIFNATDASLRASLRSLPFAAMVFIRAIILLLAGFLLSQVYGLSGILMAELISALVALIFAFYIAGPSPRLSKLFLMPSKIIYYLKCGISFLALQLLRYFSFVVDKWFVAWFVGVAALGYYSFLLITFLAFIGFAGIYNAVIIPRVIAGFGKNSNVEDLYCVTRRQAYIFICASVLFLPLYLGAVYLVIEYLLPQYNFDRIILCVAAIYVGSISHVSHGFFDSFFYSLDRQMELTIIAAGALIVFVGFYFIAGILNAEILSFCIAFVAAKLFLFLTTYLRVVFVYRKIIA